MPGSLDPGVVTQLEQLKRNYVAGLPGRLRAIETAFHDSFSRPWRKETCMTAYRLIHSLTGSAGTYGFAKLSAAARSAEILLKKSVDDRRTLSKARQAEALRLLESIRDMAGAHSGR